MTLTSTITGEWPPGVHWTPGETRVVLDLPPVAVPAWLLVEPSVIVDLGGSVAAPQDNDEEPNA